MHCMWLLSYLEEDMLESLSLHPELLSQAERSCVSRIEGKDNSHDGATIVQRATWEKEARAL